MKAHTYFTPYKPWRQLTTPWTKMQHAAMKEHAPLYMLGLLSLWECLNNPVHYYDHLNSQLLLSLENGLY